MSERQEHLYWMAMRQVFFVKQRLFSILSFMLLDNAVCSRMRSRILRALGATVDGSARIRGGLTVLESFNFTIGKLVYVGNNCTFDASAPITLEDGVSIGYGVMIVTGQHQLGPSPRPVGPTSPKPVTIRAHSGIGAGSILLPGVVIGSGSIVAAASVVTKDVPDNTMVGGHPARVMRNLHSEDIERYEMDRDVGRTEASGLGGSE